jgi:hypothetical protein
MFIRLTSRQRRADLAELLRRGLNTWERAPRWLTKLYDTLQQEIANGNKKQSG